MNREPNHKIVYKFSVSSKIIVWALEWPGEVLDTEDF